MTYARHIELDLSRARRVLVGGDIHGHLGLLKDALDRVAYDAAAGDRLILLGDLLDRGPDVLEIREWLDANSDVVPMLGNHCDMLAGSVGVSVMDDYANPLNLLRNGGDWLLRFAPGYEEDFGGLIRDLIDADTDEERQAMIDPRIVAFARSMAASPVAITVATPGRRTVGLVHGDVPCTSWSEMIEGLDDSDPDVSRHWTRQCCWSRVRFDRAKRAMVHGTPDPEDFAVPDIDHVFMGHSITKEPMTAGNCTWLDTGSYKHGLVTVVDVDTWVANLPAEHGAAA